MRCHYLAGLCLLLLAGMAAQAYQLRFKDPANAVRWYQGDYTIKGNLSLQPENRNLTLTGTMTFLEKESVTGVNPDGTANVTVEITQGTMTANVDEEAMNVPIGGYKMSFKRAPNGNVTAMKVDEQEGGIFGMMKSLGTNDLWKIMANLGQVFEFPQKELHDGDAWSNAASVELAPGNVSEMKTQVNIVGPKTVDGVPFVELKGVSNLKVPELTFNMGVGQMAMTLKQNLTVRGESYALFHEDAGEFYRSMFNGEIKMLMTLPMPEGMDDITIGGPIYIVGNFYRIQPPQE